MWQIIENSIIKKISESNKIGKWGQIKLECIEWMAI